MLTCELHPKVVLIFQVRRQRIDRVANALLVLNANAPVQRFHTQMTVKRAVQRRAARKRSVRRRAAQRSRGRCDEELQGRCVHLCMPRTAYGRSFMRFRFQVVCRRSSSSFRVHCWREKGRKRNQWLNAAHSAGTLQPVRLCARPAQPEPFQNRLQPRFQICLFILKAPGRLAHIYHRQYQ